jgi:hypothetical protein
MGGNLGCLELAGGHLLLAGARQTQKEQITYTPDLF